MLNLHISLGFVLQGMITLCSTWNQWSTTSDGFENEENTIVSAFKSVKSQPQGSCLVTAPHIFLAAVGAGAWGCCFLLLVQGVGLCRELKMSLGYTAQQHRGGSWGEELQDHDVVVGKGTWACSALERLVGTVGGLWARCSGGGRLGMGSPESYDSFWCGLQGLWPLVAWKLDGPDSTHPLDWLIDSKCRCFSACRCS